MTDREKLVDLINHVSEGHVVNLMQPGGAEALAGWMIANGVTVQEWIPVEERLPEPDEYVLCFYRDLYGKRWHTVGSVQSWNGMWGLDIDPDNDIVDEVTHWMPLPAAPKEETL